MRVSFQMLPEQPAAELVDAIAAADRLGYCACYSADEIYHKDAWLLFAAAAQRTERIRLGPCVAPIYMREPTYIAQLAATLGELAGEIADGLHTACAYSPEALDYAAEHFHVGARSAGRDPDGLDLGDSLLGAVARDGEAARRAGRILAAFYIPSMPPARLGRHGIEPESVAAVSEAFAAGDVQRALSSTPEAVADKIMVAGTPEDWVRWLTDTYAPAGMGHALVSFTDPFTLEAWAGVEIEGLPDLGEQVRLFGEHVLPEL
jgi:5,10-methylenetetrahydromethanopterin reductase